MVNTVIRAFSAIVNSRKIAFSCIALDLIYQCYKINKDISAGSFLSALSGLFLIIIIIRFGQEFILNKNIKGEIAIITIAGSLMVILLKYFITKARPDISSYSSFPSGHTYIATNYSILLLYYKTGIINLRVYLTQFCIFFAVPTLRIISKKHYMEDVICGFLIGVFNFLICKVIMNWTISHHINLAKRQA